MQIEIFGKPKKYIYAVHFGDGSIVMYYVDDNERSHISTLARREEIVIPVLKGDQSIGYESVKNTEEVRFYLVNGGFKTPYNNSVEQDDVDADFEAKDDDDQLTPEQVEEKRIKDIKDRIKGFVESTEKLFESKEIEVVEGVIAILEQVDVSEFQEFEEEAQESKNHALALMEDHLESLIKA